MTHEALRNPIVVTTAGPVRGSRKESVVAFRGIPFARAPVGERRFRPPMPAVPWTGVRDCTAFGPVCPQSTVLIEGSVFATLARPSVQDEDCLSLNIWTPGLDEGPRPVMVWIHGGAFTSGGGSSPLYDGRSFARDGVVFVTLNYRVNALGFLYLDELFDGAEGCGNAGLLDQVEALRWVQANIAAFGGDPDNVTVFGESAGGHSVGTLLATPAASGLFRRAIAQSGAGHANLRSASAQNVAARVLALVGVAHGDWEALRAVPAQRLVEAASQVALFEADELLADEHPGMRLAFAPVIDGSTLPDRADRCVASGSAAGIDLVVGSTTEEYRLFLFGLPTVLREMLPTPDIAAHFAPSGRRSDEVLNVYKERRPEASARELACAVATDSLFGIPAVRLAEAQSEVHDRVFVYQFSWRTPAGDGELGACHALDLPFVFDRFDGLSEFVGAAPPQGLADVMHGAWVQFAKTGDPGWPAYDIERRAVMNFGELSALVEDPASEERELWNGLW